MTTTRTTRRWTTSSCRRRRRRLPRRPIKRLRPPNRPPLQFPRPLSSLLRKPPPPRQLRQRRERAIARLLAESPKPAPRWTSPWLPMKLVGKTFCWNLKVKNKKLKSRSNCFIIVKERVMSKSIFLSNFRVRTLKITNFPSLIQRIWTICIFSVSNGKSSAAASNAPTTANTGFALPASIAVKSSTVQNIEKMQKDREERRAQQEREKKRAELEKQLDPGNPNYQFLVMIRDYQVGEP